MIPKHSQTCCFSKFYSLQFKTDILEVTTQVVSRDYRRAMHKICILFSEI